jgi:hypothetical protein
MMMSQPASSPKAPPRVAVDPKTRVAKTPKFQPEGVHAFEHTPVAGVVCVHARGMKEAWHLATSRRDRAAS